MKIKNVGLFWGAILNLFIQILILIRGFQDGYDAGGISAVGGWVVVIYLCVE